MPVGFTENSVAASSTTPFVAPISLDGAAPTQIGGWKISIPLDWTRRERHVLEVVRWYTSPLDRSSHTNDMHWQGFADIMGQQRERDTMQRELLIYAISEAAWEQYESNGSRMNVINVHAAGLDGRSPFNEYDLREKR